MMPELDEQVHRPVEKGGRESLLTPGLRIEMVSDRSCRAGPCGQMNCWERDPNIGRARAPIRSQVDRMKTHTKSSFRHPLDADEQASLQICPRHDPANPKDEAGITYPVLQPCRVDRQESPGIR